MSTPTIRESGIRDVVFGEDVIVHQPVNLYGCQIGDQVMIGPFVEIQCGVRVGARSRIQSHAFLCEGVTIGADWLTGQLTGGVLHNDQYDFDDYGLTIDAGLSLSAVTGHDTTVGSISDAIAAHIGDYIAYPGHTLAGSIAKAAAFARWAPAALSERSTHWAVSFSCSEFWPSRWRSPGKSTSSSGWSWLKHENT